MTQDAHDESESESDPDVTEEDLAGELDLALPHDLALTRVVGIGGSAGSIAAMQRLLRMMPADPGMAFVVVMHLSPEHDSILGAVLQAASRMPVETATDGARVLPNHVYVIPPGKSLSLTDGSLRLTDLERTSGRRLTVDLFFRSLADTHGPHAIAIVLSGADGDGALGIKRIKERGGLTIAQDPDEAEHADMPIAAIATSMVDWVLTTEKMPEQLLAYHAREPRLNLPPEIGPNPAIVKRPSPSAEEAALRDVLLFLRARTGRDFSYYKRATIVRRVARRMQVNSVEDLPSYLSFLRLHPGEAGALLQDLLISVTNFFRDREAFDALEARLPDLFHNKTAADSIRVWVPACATGEEAYSVAILLSEYARTLDAPPAIQIFATDLDEDVLAEARNGVYPASISTDVSAERLQRFFVKEHHGYRVRRELREMLLFAVHDVLKDSPFSRLDLLSCRNLLIYLNRSAQRRAFEIFHFALRHDGLLFLGTSEAADDSSALFVPLDKKYRIYASRSTARPSLPMPLGPSTLARVIAQNEGDPATSLARRPPAQLGLTSSLRLSEEDRVSWSELHLKLIERFGPPSLVINGEQEIVHLSAAAGQFLQFGGGEPTTQLFRVIHPMLRAELRALVFRARQTGEPSVAPSVPITLGEETKLVDLLVSPAAELAPDFLLISFALRPATEAAAQVATAKSEPVTQHLERELEQTKLRLRDLVEQHEASTEELKASNEELQAMNEELRSATEELETGREELQSINEELTTVNQELKSNVEELGRSNSDLHNLMGATKIATVFLDRELRITRFTPPAVELFSLIPTDLGRPLSDLQHRLSYPELISDAARVLQELVPVEREVGETGGHFFLVRLLPYRTLEDRVPGVVLTFVDVTELHLAQRALKNAQRELEQRVIERTAQLDRVNGTLRAEVLMHQRAEKARQELQRRLVTAQEEERSRISRELHDEVGQQLTALALLLKSLENDANADCLNAKLRELRSMAESVGGQIHQLATELRPVALDQLGLQGALSGYLDSWRERSGVAVDLFCAGIDQQRLPRAIETTLYRIVQEAMNNIYKHAKATNVSVSIERRGDQVLAIIEDNGAGFTQEAQPNELVRIGVAGMRERAAIVGGDLTIESTAGDGTIVRARLPIPPE
ncbi:MAG TPA: chemotaxis protein CheB [Polyangiaceae bacterium]|nr:chemotaxis protein CheB [Polyangiaceae bacterium]